MQTTYTGIDWFDFTALRPAEEHSGAVTVCNMREHEHGIAEYVLLNMLEVSEGLRGAPAALSAPMLFLVSGKSVASAIEARPHPIRSLSVAAERR